MVKLVWSRSDDMPRFPRLVVPGFPHHVTQRGVRRQSTFFDEADFRAYLRLAAELRDSSAIDIWAYCLMPNHMHAVVVPAAEDSLSSYFGALHQRYAKRTNARHEWAGHLWQKRFFSAVMDESHTISAMRYVEMNPVRAGLCKRPEDWPWSSARGNLKIAPDSLIDRSNTKNIVADWAGYLYQEEEAKNLQRLRRQTDTGRPAGSAEFVELLESRTGRRLRRRRAGRKKK